MKLNKIISLLISGSFLIFISLSDLDNFNIPLHGFFLAIGILAIVMAVIGFIQSKKKDV